MYTQQTPQMQHSRILSNLYSADTTDPSQCVLNNSHGSYAMYTQQTTQMQHSRILSNVYSADTTDPSQRVLSNSHGSYAMYTQQQPQIQHSRIFHTVYSATFTDPTQFILSRSHRCKFHGSFTTYIDAKFTALVRTDISEECSPSIIKVTRIGELGTTLAVTSNRCTLFLREFPLARRHLEPAQPL
jgi:hypothetical protein